MDDAFVEPRGVVPVMGMTFRSRRLFGYAPRPPSISRYGCPSTTICPCTVTSVHWPLPFGSRPGESIEIASSTSEIPVTSAPAKSGS